MNLILAVLTSVGPAAKTADKQCFFEERIICPDHWAGLTSLARSSHPVIGKTRDYCHYCAEAETALINSMRLQDWFTKVKPSDTVYISGPMSGLPDYNRLAFWRMEHALKVTEAKILSPAHHDKDLEYADYMKASMDMVFACTCVVTLEGWEKSRGASAELSLAYALGKPVHYYKTNHES